MADVMWATPDDRRTLLAPNDAVASFVGGIYWFDDVRVVPFDLKTSRLDALAMRAGDLEIELRAGRAFKIFRVRPRILRRRPAWVRFENLLLRPLFGRFALRGATGVRAYGVSPSGVREWYCVDEYRPVIAGSATHKGKDLGTLTNLDPPARFGFSEFPTRPALVRCAPLLKGADRFLSDA
jgi:hypothetical protein